MLAIGRPLLLFFLSLTLSGCAMSWQPSWQKSAEDLPTPQSVALLDQAQNIFAAAGDRASLLQSIDAFTAVLRENPGDYRALAQLSTQYILLGTAYTESRQQKSINFQRAMHYAELAMYTNPTFRQQASEGKTPWEAVDTLTANETEAMFFWVTALQYEFKESMSLPEKIINVGWLQKSLIVLDRIEMVAPEFGNGAVEFAKAICYYALPTIKGGSKKIGDQYMQRAIAKGDDWLFSRWARGKYYYPIIGEKEKSRQDLRWVATQELTDFSDPYPWRIHFQDNARQLLR